MSCWSERLMTLLDGQATMLETERGPIQVAREGDGPKVMTIHGSPGGFDQGLFWARPQKRQKVGLKTCGGHNYVVKRYVLGPTPETNKKVGARA